MKISIVVPIYNVERYLARCIESIIYQTYRDIDIILVNDGSTDSSLEICEAFGLKDNRIRVISQVNRGLAGARNIGIKEAKGEYICFIDSDDEVESNMIEVCTTVIEKDQPDIIISNILSYKRDNKEFFELRNDLPYGQKLNSHTLNEYFIKPYYGGFLGVIPSACNKLYKTSFLKQYDLQFDESLKRSEDYWFNFKAFQIADSAFAIDRAFYHYYCTTGSMIKSFREGQFETFLKNRTILLENHKFNFPINWTVLNNQFVRNINELILSEINAKGLQHAYRNIRRYLENTEFRKIYSSSTSPKVHVELIKRLIMARSYFPAILIYYIWSIKAKQ